MTTDDLTPEAVAALSGAAISVFFNIFPKLSERFHSLDSDGKQKFMFALSAGASLIAALWICSEDVNGLLICLKGGWRTLIQSVVAGWIANTGMDRALPEAFKRGKIAVQEKRDEQALEVGLDLGPDDPAHGVPVPMNRDASPAIAANNPINPTR